MKKTTYYPGENISLTMMKPEKGNFPISRTPEGMICLIEKSDKKAFYPYGSSWDCEIVEVREKSLIIRPISMETSAEMNKLFAEQKAKEVFGNKKAAAKTEKPKYNYSYNSKNG